MTASTASPTARRSIALATREWGTGDRLALLVHGMMSDSSTWWRVGPELAARGYRVIAVDLPGHGRSPRSSDADLQLFTRSVVAAVPRPPELVIAHSAGAFVVAAALDQLRPRRAVYVDVPFGPSRQMPDPASIASGYERARARRTQESLASAHPDWSPADCAAEAAAAQCFDVPTAVSLLADAAGRDLTPEATVPTLMVHADPSRNVKPALAERLALSGWTVRSIPGADHIVWYGRVAEFIAALDGWA